MPPTFLTISCRSGFIGGFATKSSFVSDMRQIRIRSTNSLTAAWTYHYAFLYGSGLGLHLFNSLQFYRYTSAGFTERTHTRESAHHRTRGNT